MLLHVTGEAKKYNFGVVIKYKISIIISKKFILVFVQEYFSFK